MKKPRKIVILLIILFLFTRLYNIGALPIFTDESIYIYWAKHISTYNSNWFMSLTDGKPPLFIWIITFLLKIMPSDMYLFAGRLVSVIAGGIATVGIYKLAKIIFKSDKVAIIAVFLSIVNPFILFHDRMALYDSLLSALLIWSVYFMIKTSITFRKVHAIFWGLFLGLALLTKPPALIFLLLEPFCFLILVWKKNKSSRKKLVILPFIAIGIGLLMDNIQRLSLNYQLVSEKNQQFQLPINEFFSAPFSHISGNLQLLLHWIVSYYTLPIFLAGCLGFIYLLVKKKINAIVLLILWLVPIVIIATVGQILFSRYILFTTPYFLIVFAAFIYLIYKKIGHKITIIAVFLLTFMSLRFDFFLLTDPSRAPFPKEDYSQYVTSRYSGYGLQQIFDHIDNELENGPGITLLTEGKFGLFPYAFNLYYWSDSRVFVVSSWIPEKLEYDLYEMKKSARVYMVFSSQKSLPRKFPLYLRAEYGKPEGDEVILLGEVKDKI
jgi:4-amino-4-deoxy-L-arabinose transferase-like glycosyltransferase